MTGMSRCRRLPPRLLQHHARHSMDMAVEVALQRPGGMLARKITGARC